MRIAAGLVFWGVLAAATLDGRASTLTAVGTSKQPADRAVVQLYLREELRDEPARAERDLAEKWKKARQWLENFGVAEDQIYLREPATRMLQDQKRYLVRRVSIVIKLKPGAAPDEETETIAQLVDQLGVRGLMPASHLALMSIEPDSMQVMGGPPEAQNHFVFYLPPEPERLAKEATKDALAKLAAQAKELGDATGFGALKLTDLSVDANATRPTDLKAGRIGLCGVTPGDVMAAVNVTGEYEPHLANEADTKAARLTALSVNGTARVPAHADQAVIQTRLAAPDASLQKAMDRLNEQTERVRRAAGKAKGATLELGNVAFFNGYGFPGIGGDLAEGQLPAGAYRDARVLIKRPADEDEAAFGKRVEKLAAAMHPNAGAGGPGGGGPEPGQLDGLVQATWGPADSTPFLRDAIKQAMADARRNAELVADAAGWKVGRVLSVDLNGAEGVGFQGAIMSQFAGGGFMPPNGLVQAPQQQQGALPYVVASRLSEKPGAGITVSVRFATERP